MSCKDCGKSSKLKLGYCTECYKSRCETLDRLLVQRDDSICNRTDRTKRAAQGYWELYKLYEGLSFGTSSDVALFET